MFTILIKRAVQAGLVCSITLLAASLSGCTHPLDTYKNLTAPDLTARYIGRSQADIMACAGQPYGRYKTPRGENLIYHYSGAGPVPGGGKNWTCSATMQFDAGRLTAVNYAPKEVESPYTENGKKKPNLPSCNFSLPKCG